ncbi:hypothetical protein [Puia dinghuensis]|uniref:DUF3078 domain-containing protein n=1 Tax=Puia dinghuensis TaxID=1792502 RepID=A0A8J2UGM2_9BACT|nr:hypothetical protein [Puia dinghuensis]GGB14696.1 hypothetical protein GCM10011511_43070 [Puia dinghuensis]
MLSLKCLLCLLAGMLLFRTISHGQVADSLTEKVIRFPARLFSRIQGKTASLDRQLARQTDKMLERMARREERLRRRLSRIDSASAQRLFAGSAEQYAALARSIVMDSGSVAIPLSGEYLPYVDSLKGSLFFLQQNPQWVGAASPTQLAQVQGSMAQFQQLQAKLGDADQIKAFIRQRKEAIKQYLSRYTNLPPGIAGEYQGLNREAYYYAEQVREYKQLLNDPDRLEKKALSLLGQLPAFRQFMKNNGQLAGLFGVPAGYGSPTALAGLQTRDQVTQAIQSQLATGGQGALSALHQNLQSAEQQLDGFKDKLNHLGSGSGDIDMPNFKPNGQRTKSLWRRLEAGVNLQTSRTNRYYPNVLDLGGSLGYRLTDKSTIGVGTSLKIGLGSDFRHMALTASGASLRSYVDIVLKGSFFASGGLEYNHTSALRSYQDIRRLSGWTTSGLIGITKTVSVKSRVFKKTKLSLLWDFLSYRQRPQTPAIVYRLGYSF